MAVAAGSYYADAAAYAGITYTTFRNWMLRGENAGRGMRDAPFLALFEAVTRAEAEAKVLALTKWRTAFDTDWRAIQMFMERRYPNEWGRKDRIEFSELLRKDAERLSEETGLSVYDIIQESENIARSGF
jgi:transposase